MEEKMIKFGDFLGVFLETVTTITYTQKRCDELIATSTDEQELSKAKRVRKLTELAREGVKNYDALKSKPEYAVAFKKFGIDKLNDSMLKLCKC